MFDAGIERAIEVALVAHAGQVRKGNEVPYSVHPVHVALMLSRFGADSEVVQAGLLHDVVEDCETWTLARVEGEFGARVASLVGEVSEDKRGTWDERKDAAIEHVPDLTEGALLVKACDKLHNLGSLAASLGHSEDPEDVWARFKAGREGTLEMSDRLVSALELRLDPALGAALRAALTAVERA